MGNSPVRADNTEPRSFFLLEAFSSSLPRGRREKQITLAFCPPASTHLLLKCKSSWTTCPLGQHPAPLQPQVGSSCTGRKGEGRLVSKGPSLANTHVCPKIPACLSGQPSFMRGNSIYFEGSLPSPEGIRSLEFLNPVRAKRLSVLFLNMSEGGNLWGDLARRLNCSILGAAWSAEMGRAAWEVLPGSKLRIRKVRCLQHAMEEFSTEGGCRLQRKTMHQSYYSQNTLQRY